MRIYRVEYNVMEPLPGYGSLLIVAKSLLLAAAWLEANVKAMSVTKFEEVSPEARVVIV